MSKKSEIDKSESENSESEKQKLVPETEYWLTKPETLYRAMATDPPFNPQIFCQLERSTTLKLMVVDSFLIF